MLTRVSLHCTSTPVPMCPPLSMTHYVPCAGRCWIILHTAWAC
jgi:hypothetical protein